MNRCFTTVAVVFHLSSAFTVPPRSKNVAAGDDHSLQTNREMSDACFRPTWHLNMSASATSSSEQLHHLMKAQASQPETISASRKEAESVKTIFVDNGYGWGFTTGLIKGCPALCDITNNPQALQKPLAAVVKNAIWGGSFRGDPASTAALVAAGTKLLFNIFYEGPNHYDGTKKDLHKWTQIMNGSADWTIHFASDSDFLQRMVSFEKTTCTGSNTKTNYAAGRKFTMMWMTSDCGPRVEFAKALQKRIGEDQFHIYTSTCDVPGARAVPCEGWDESTDCFQQLFSQYKFYASFENLRCDGYITEKFHRGFLEGMVPVVLGGISRADVALGVANDSFVHTDEFNSYDEMAHYLSTISDDDYNKYHEWRDTYRVMTLDEANDESWCNLCTELHKSPNEQKPKFSGDLTDRIFKDRCTTQIPEWTM